MWKPTQPIKITVCCGNHLVSRGIESLIKEFMPDIATAHVCPHIAERWECDADLLITDLNTLLELDTEGKLSEKGKIILLGTRATPYLDHQRLLTFLPQGLAGILSPQADIEEFKRAVNKVRSGELWFDRKQLSLIVKNLYQDQAKSSPQFTKRELEIVKMICRGSRNKEIMGSLNISEQCVKAHLNKIYKKAGVSDRLNLVIQASNRWPVFLAIPQEKLP